MLNYYLFAAGPSFFDMIKGEASFGTIIISFVRTICYLLASLIYKGVRIFFTVFSLMTNGELLNSSDLNDLFGRVGLLLGVVMLFRIAFVFIQALIDPDNAIKDKQKGIPTVIKKAIIVIIMFGMSGYVFDLSRQVQVLVVKNHVIEELLLPQEVDTDNFAGALTANLFTSFYNVDPSLNYQVTDATDKYCVDQSETGYLNQLRLHIAQDGDFSYGKEDCLNAWGSISGTKDFDFLIDFNVIFCILAGGAALYFALSYTIQIGMRMIQLAVLQILSPVAFVGYLEPKQDNMFSKWLKLYTSTYLDVFIRMVIIDFVFYLIALIMESWNEGATGAFWKSMGNPTGIMRLWIGVLMIIALFSFALKAPKLLGDLFPNVKGSGALSLSPSLKETAAGQVFGVGAAAAGMGISAVTGVGKNVGKKIGRAFDNTMTGNPHYDNFKNKLDSIKNSQGVGMAKNFGGKLTRGMNTVKGNVKSTYGTLKSGYEAGKKHGINPIAATYSGYKAGSNISIQNTNSVGSYLNQIDAAIKDNGDVKRANKRFEDLQTELNSQYAQGNISLDNLNQRINEEKDLLDGVKAKAYEAAIKSKDATSNIYAAVKAAKAAGIDIPDHFADNFDKDGNKLADANKRSEGFKQIKDKQDAKTYGDYRPK